MPLPKNGTTWPPKSVRPLASKFAEWGAWFSAEPKSIARFYQRGGPSTTSRVGGVKGALQRFWWGRPTSQESDTAEQAHIPVASDIATGSSNLLYSEPPVFTCSEGDNQTSLDAYSEDFHRELSAGAEIGAALGGRYHRVTWDRALLGTPFITTINPESAVPEFRYGRLVAVTLWFTVDISGQRYTRHLERHELDTAGNGLIIHGLYEGGADSLGMVRPLTEHPSTAHLAEVVDENGAVRDGRTPGLCVAYVANQTPQRGEWRFDPIGQHLGRSDYDGVEGLMDNLDEAFSSWMRDIRIGKGRVMVPYDYMRDNGPGLGADFDLDRTVYDALNVMPGEAAGSQIVAQQFKIRVDEHERTCNDILVHILNTAGYSPSTFGVGGDGVAMTATEVQARERKSFLTRGRKIRIERPAVSRLLTKMLSIDAAIFGTTGLITDAKVTVEFGDNVQDSMLTIATTVETLYRAKSASVRTRLQILHPQWDEPRIDEEVTAILSEDGTVTDPFSIGG